MPVAGNAAEFDIAAITPMELMIFIDNFLAQRFPQSIKGSHGARSLLVRFDGCAVIGRRAPLPACLVARDAVVAV